MEPHFEGPQTQRSPDLEQQPLVKKVNFDRPNASAFVLSNDSMKELGAKMLGSQQTEHTAALLNQKRMRLRLVRMGFESAQFQQLVAQTDIARFQDEQFEATFNAIIERILQR